MARIRSQLHTHNDKLSRVIVGACNGNDNGFGTNKKTSIRAQKSIIERNEEKDEDGEEKEDKEEEGKTIQTQQLSITKSYFFFFLLNACWMRSMTNLSFYVNHFYLFPIFFFGHDRWSAPDTRLVVVSVSALLFLCISFGRCNGQSSDCVDFSSHRWEVDKNENQTQKVYENHQFVFR